MTILFIWKERCKNPRLPIRKGNTQCKLAEQEGAKGTCNSDSHKQVYCICIKESLHKPKIGHPHPVWGYIQIYHVFTIPFFVAKKLLQLMTLNHHFGHLLNHSVVPARFIEAQVSGENRHDSDSLFARRPHVSFRPGGGSLNRSQGNEGFSNHDMFLTRKASVVYMVIVSRSICITKTLDFGYPEKMIV